MLKNTKNIRRELFLNRFDNHLQEVFMRIPLPGENIMLLYKECNHLFSGPCPDNFGLGILVNKIIQKPKCPNCGLTKDIKNPFIKY
jgi:hypothetical protein